MYPVTGISNISGPTVCIFISTFTAEYIFAFFLAATKRRHTARLRESPAREEGTLQCFQQHHGLKKDKAVLQREEELFLPV